MSKHEPKSYESHMTCTACGMPVLEHDSAEQSAHGITVEHIAEANAEHVSVYGRPLDAALSMRGVL